MNHYLLSEPHCGAKVESARLKTEKTEKNTNKIAQPHEKMSKNLKIEEKSAKMNFTVVLPINLSKFSQKQSWGCEVVYIEQYVTTTLFEVIFVVKPSLLRHRAFLLLHLSVILSLYFLCRLQWPVLIGAKSYPK